MQSLEEKLLIASNELTRATKDLTESVRSNQEMVEVLIQNRHINYEHKLEAEREKGRRKMWMGAFISGFVAVLVILIYGTVIA